MSQIEAWIEKNKNSIRLLPCSHVMLTEYVGKLLDRGHFTTEFSFFPPKDVTTTLSQENVIYAFYGLPLYIVKSKTIGNSEVVNYLDATNLPVGFIFKKEILNMADRMYAFDSGALFWGLLNEYITIHPDHINQYYCIKDICTTQNHSRMIDRYFTTNYNYINGKADFTDALLSKEEGCLTSLYNNDNKITSLDQRSKTYEIIFKDNLPINVVEYVLMPRSFKFTKKDWIKTLEEDHKCKVEYYDISEAFGGDFMKICKNLQSKAKNLLSIN